MEPVVLWVSLDHSFFVCRLLEPCVCGRQGEKRQKHTELERVQFLGNNEHEMGPYTHATRQKHTLNTRGWVQFWVPPNTRGCLARKARTRTEKKGVGNRKRIVKYILQPLKKLVPVHYLCIVGQSMAEKELRAANRGRLVHYRCRNPHPTPPPQKPLRFEKSWHFEDKSRLRVVENRNIPAARRRVDPIGGGREKSSTLNDTKGRRAARESSFFQMTQDHESS